MIARIDEWYSDNGDIEEIRGNPIWALVTPWEGGAQHDIVKILSPYGGARMSYLKAADGDKFEIDPVDVPSRYLVAAMQHDLLGETP